jgi:hypothetical protein
MPNEFMGLKISDLPHILILNVADFQSLEQHLNLKTIENVEVINLMNVFQLIIGS